MLLSRLVPQLPDPHTSWLTLAMSSTLAGNLTLVGSIANLIVLEGARRHGVEITFWQYCKVGAPVTLLTLLFGVWWLCCTVSDFDQASFRLTSRRQGFGGLPSCASRGGGTRKPQDQKRAREYRPTSK